MYTILNSVATALVDYATTKGLTMEEVTEVSGIARRDLINPDARVSHEGVPMLAKMLLERFPGEPLPIKLAGMAPPSVFGPITYGMQYASRFYDCLQRFRRYSMILSEGLNVDILEQTEQVCLTCHHPMDTLDGGFMAEFGFSLAHRILNEQLPEHLKIKRVEFSHSPLFELEHYKAFFNCPVEFEAPKNALIFDPESMDIPPAQVDKEAFNYAEHYLQSMAERVNSIPANESLAKVKQAIAMNAANGEYHGKVVAQSMNMSLRNLQRQLEPFHVSLKDLIDEHRYENARRLVVDKRLSEEDVAAVLGYSEGRAFRRAFKRWSDMTPVQYRRANALM